MDDDATGEDRQRAEAAPPRREPFFNLPPVVLGLIVACVAIHLFRLYGLDARQDNDLILRFAFIPLRYSGGYAIDVEALLALFTYSLLHGGYLHLGINMIWLAAFGSPLASRIGTLRFLLFWALTSLAAVLLHFVLQPFDPSPVVGASGAISGMMGAAARFGFHIDRASGKPAFSGLVLSIPQVLRSRTAVVFLVVWMAANVVTGLGYGAPDGMARIAWEAHIGGFVAGFFGVFLFDRPAGPLPPQTGRGREPEGA